VATASAGPMDDTVEQLARELAEAIAEAVANSPEVDACHEKGRLAGYDMRVSLEAAIAFVNRRAPAAVAPAVTVRPSRQTAPRALDINANDRRFLRSLRIASDEPAEEVE